MVSARVFQVLTLACMFGIAGQVDAANDAPNLNPIGNRTVQAGSPLSFQISATDANNDPLSFGTQSAPGHWPVIQGDPWTTALRSHPSAPAYYIDSRNGNDSANGRTPATAWKTLDRLQQVLLGPGDVVRLARDSVWSKQQIYLKTGSKGSADAPIIIEAYGRGSAPTISDPYAFWDKTRKHSCVYLVEDQSHIRVLELRMTLAQGSPAVLMQKTTHNITIAGCEILHCGTGVRVEGRNQRVLSCYIHDIDQSTGSGIGIVFLGEYFEFGWNRLSRCYANRPSDGKLDGAPFEFYGRVVLPSGEEVYDMSRDIVIHHNRVEENLIFIETYGDVTNLTIAHNLYLNSGPNPLVIHYDDCEHATWTHGSTYTNFQVLNNTFIARIDPEPGGWGMIGLLVDYDHTPDPAINTMTVRNNVFYTNYTILSWVNPLGASLVHDHNLFHFVGDGRLSTTQGVWVQDPTEVIGDALFVNAAAGNFRLRNDSPARNAGAPSLFSVDLDGTQIPAGSAPDIGAYEFH